MICPGCRLQVAADAPTCGTCGASCRIGHGALALVLPDARRVALEGCVTVGRSDTCTVQVDEPTVSRVHARILAAIDPPILQDAGSSNGTYLNGLSVRASGMALTEGAVLHLGDAQLRVERVDAAGGPWRGGATIHARPGAPDGRLRLREGVTVTHAEHAGRLTYTVYAPEGHDIVRVGGADAALLERIDGATSIDALVDEIRRTRGAWGVGRLAQLVAVLAERGLVDGAVRSDPPRAGLLRRLLAPRDLLVPGAGRALSAIYRRGGFLLVTRLGLAALMLTAAAGFVAFIALVTGPHATPFVVQSQLIYGIPAFVLGRLLSVALHEMAHGLVLASFGHTVARAGVTLVAGIPFAFVDSSPGWRESRSRRLAVSAAGPACDLMIGGVCALAAFALQPAVASELAFQLALAAYVGAAVNLNPMLERDGHHILEDLAGEPGLRRRAQTWIATRVAGDTPSRDDSRALRLYGVAGLTWTLLLAALVLTVGVIMAPRLSGVLPAALLWCAVGALTLLVLAPIAQQIVVPAWVRLRGR